jgi:hypothetical protein
MSKKIQNIYSLIEIAENNLNNAKILINQIIEEKKINSPSSTFNLNDPELQKRSHYEDSSALETMEGYFDGESMLGDNGKFYTVPQNYASKTQLVIGDRLKWTLTTDKELFKLIAPAERERLVGHFSMDADNYVVVTDKQKEPIKILKASATFAMKNLGLEFGDEVVLIVPKNVTPTWGAFSSVVKALSEYEKNQIKAESAESIKQDKKDTTDQTIENTDMDFDKTTAAKKLKKNSKTIDDTLEFDYL